MYFLNSRAALWSFMAATAIATYDATAKTNVALYYGQGPNEATTYGLAYFCASSSVDIIPLAFMNKYPSQGNGYPGTNFGGSCWGGSYVYSGPGSDPSLNDLQAKCPSLVSAIPDCQTMYGKKILLSLGGFVASGQTAYQLMSAQDGEDLADFLWGAFGPLTANWTAANLPRPFDTEGTVNEVDGFDFDIEVTTSGEQAYYVALLNRLRSNFPTGPGCKEYIISGAPQCLTPDSNMAQMITTTQFDVIWTQYYNTPQCSARNWINSNPNYSSTLQENPSGFKSNYDAFVQSLQGTPSENAMLYLGLLGSPSAGTSTDYLDPDCEVKPLIQAHYCNKNFGGVMIWEAVYATNITENQNTFYEEVKAILLDVNSLTCPNGATSSTSASTVVASTSSSTAPSSSSTPCSTTSSTSASSLATSSSASSSTALSTSSTLHTTTSSSTSASSSTTSSSVGTSSSTTPSSSSTPYSTMSSSTSASSSTASSSVRTSSSTTPTSASIPGSTTSSSVSVSSSTSSVGSSSGSSSSSSPATSLSSTSYSYPQGSNSSSIARSTTTSVSGLPGTSTVSSTGSSIVSSTGSPIASSTGSPIASSTGSPIASSAGSPIGSSTGSSTGSSIGSSTGSSTSVPSSTSAYSSIGPYSNSTSSTYNPPASSSVAVSSSASLTTITTTTTSVYTITSCPPVVTNCPIGKVTTDIITITTTFCPASAGSTAAPVTTPYTTSTAAPVTASYTTSTVYTTLVYTVTSCAPTVTNCPAKLGHVTTETVALYTTVCPIAAINTPSPVQAIEVPLESTSTVSQTTMQTVAITVPKGGVAPSAESTIVQTRVVSVVPLPVATPGYVTKVGAGPSVESTAVQNVVVSVVPLPVATPSYATNAGPSYANNAGPSYATNVGAASPSGAACGTAGCAYPSSSAIVPFKGAASKARLGAASLASVVLVMAGMLML